jgi:UDP-N-acetylglucosamine 1-carboxyvinyltransferase
MATHIGQQIADLRETQGMTQGELAKHLKTTQSAIARIESGKQNVSADMLKKISRALKKNLVTLSPGTMNLSINGGKKTSRNGDDEHV